MSAHTARCSGCNAIVGIVFHQQPGVVDDEALIAWWRAKGLRVEMAYITERAFELDACRCPDRALSVISAQAVTRA